MFKTETHLHTMEVSSCSRIRAREMMRRYKEAGYSTVFVSDHFQSNSLDVLGDIPWSDKITIFLSGYYRAKTEGDKLGLNVLPSVEFCFSDTKNHYLAYGITKEFLVNHPELHKMRGAEFLPIARAEGIYIVHAHPFRDGSTSAAPELVDAVEVYNSNPRHEDNSDLSVDLAKRYGLPETAGSDAHSEEDVARSGVITDEEIKSADDYIRLLRAGRVKLIKGEEV